MKQLKLLVAAFLVLGATNIQAQKIKITEGDLSFLKGQTEVLVEYDYSQLAVGKFDKEADYVAKKVEEYNKKEAGKGDTWAQSWEADREGRYHPKYEELLNSYTSKINCSFNQTNANAQYTLILKTTFIEPGWNIGISRMDASINVEIIFVETVNHDNKLAVITMTAVPGRGAMGNDYDTGFRIQEAFAKCGKETGAFLVKKAFK